MRAFAIIGFLAVACAALPPLPRRGEGERLNAPPLLLPLPGDASAPHEQPSKEDVVPTEIIPAYIGSQTVMSKERYASINFPGDNPDSTSVGGAYEVYCLWFRQKHAP